MLICSETVSAVITSHSCSYIFQHIFTEPSCMSIFLHRILDSCSHISPLRCKLLRLLEGLSTQETTCNLCLISSPSLCTWYLLMSYIIACAPNISLVGKSFAVLQQCNHCSIFWQKSSFLASLTKSRLLVLSYITTLKHSSSLKYSHSIVNGVCG